MNAIFKLTGINRPTVVRMLETLEHGGYVIRDPQRKTYMPSGRTLELSSGYDFFRGAGLIAAPTLLSLRREIGWPSDFAVFNRDAMVVVGTSRGQERLFFNRSPGYRAPMLATSLGLAYLAFCREDQRKQALANAAKLSEPWNALALDANRITATLSKIKKKGYATMNDAYSSQEYSGLVTAVGVPIMSNQFAIAAINILYLKDAISSKEFIAKHLDRLVATADSLGKAISRAGLKLTG